VFYHDKKLQYTVRVDSPNPVFARQLQQAIGGIEGEIRVATQYLFQAWGSRGPARYRDMRLETGTEELAHVEMLATAVAMNLDGAETEIPYNDMHPAVMAKLGGQDPRQYLSAGLAALPADANGVPFDMSHVYASGNLAADMYANVAAEATGRALAARLYHMTEDAGMKDMLSFLIARDTMHQQQWLAVLEELGPQHLPIPNSLAQEDLPPEHQQPDDIAYGFVSTAADDIPPPEGRWTEGPSLDGRGHEFRPVKARPMGQEPELGMARPDAYAQAEQTGTDGRARASRGDSGGGLVDKAKDVLRGE
jgi:Mn-containing catalase